MHIGFAELLSHFSRSQTRISFYSCNLQAAALKKSLMKLKSESNCELKSCAEIIIKTTTQFRRKRQSFLLFPHQQR
jgi:hypothetical protein